jgi:hypothetical protein
MAIFFLKFDTKLYNINFRKMDQSGTVQKTWYKISPKNTAPERVKALEEPSFAPLLSEKYQMVPKGKRFVEILVPKNSMLL